MEQPDTQKQINNTLLKMELADISTMSFDVALTAIRDYIQSNPTKITLIMFAILSHLDMGAYRRAMGKV